MPAVAGGGRSGGSGGAGGSTTSWSVPSRAPTPPPRPRPSASRYAHLRRVSDVATRVLRDGPLPEPRLRQAFVPGRWMLPALAVLVVAVVVWRDVTPPVLPHRPDPVAIGADLGGVSLASVSDAV